MKALKLRQPAWVVDARSQYFGSLVTVVAIKKNPTYRGRDFISAKVGEGERAPIVTFSCEQLRGENGTDY